MATTEYARDSDGTARFLLQVPAFQGLARQARRVGLLPVANHCVDPGPHRRTPPSYVLAQPRTSDAAHRSPRDDRSTGAGKSGCRRSAADPLVACSHRGAPRRRSREGASGGSWVQTLPRKTREGNPPRWIPFPLTAAPVDRTGGQVQRPEVDQTVAGTPS
jgi:hypothetical protein